MIWRKRGLVFEPSRHGLPPGCTEFAQSPQALVRDDHVRIFFSTRSRDEATGKYLSHVAYVDMDRDLTRVRRVAPGTVLPPGNRGCFDEHGIFPFSPLRHDGAVLAYTCGWTRRVSVSVDTGIGLAISHDDGETFRRYADGPVLTTSLHEPMLVGDPFVLHAEGAFHMWYIFGQRWLPPTPSEPPARVYKIAHATSPDGIHWRKEDGRTILPDVLNPDECQALPTVLRIGSRYHMFFCFRQATDFRTNPGRAYRLGYAWSDDLQTWTRDDATSGIAPSAEGWDSEMMCYPNLFACDGRVFLLYNGNAFGRHGFGAAEWVGS